MWYLHCLNDSYIYLWEKNTYSVGRKNKDIIIENDDSISRIHGLFEIKNDGLYLTDLGSKYGTFIGKDKMEANKETKVSENLIITFGLLDNTQSKFKVKRLNFKVVLSNVKSNIKHNLYTALDTLKAIRSSTWDKYCTHLVVSEVILTSKVLCALTLGQYIVDINFFGDFVKAVQSNAKPPKESDYIPIFNEALLNKNIKLEFHPNRKNLFKDLIFVFLTEKCKKSLEEVIRTTGGEVLSWQKQEFSLDVLKSKQDNYLFIEDHSETINKESAIYKSFQQAIKYFISLGRRPIPLQEIALAIIHNSTEENCNTLFNRAALLIPKGTQQISEEILVYDTEHSSGSRSENSLSSLQIPSVVEPSFEVTESCNTMGIKRPLEIAVDDSNKRYKNDSSSSCRQISLQKSSNTVQTLIQSNLKSIFTSKTNIDDSEKNVKKDEIELGYNPFSRKRKATNILNQEFKKRPLENIGNLKLSESKPISNIKKNETNNDKSVKDLKFILSTSWIKKENNFEEIKKEEIEDEEITKLNEIFRDSILIQYCTIAPTKSKNKSVTNSDSLKNFKKFKKTHQNIQSEIVSDLSKVVIGDESICPSDEKSDNEEMDTLDSTFTTGNRPQQRRRFQFFT